jgi:protein TonB
VSKRAYALQRWMRQIDEVRGAVMFQGSLVESTSLLRGRSRWPAVISFGLQAVIAAVVIVLPLMHPEILSVRAPRILVTAPWMQPPVVPQPRVRVETSSSTNAVSAPAPATRSATLTIRDPGVAFVDEPALPTGVNLAENGGGPISLLGPGGPVGPHVVVRPAAAAGPLHISSGVMEGELLEPISPEYPVIAKLSHTEGTVVVQAVISKSGQIESARVVSGPAVLQGAALQAVREARYRPFLLNGLPTEVETTVSIVFRMGS